MRHGLLMAALVPAMLLFSGPAAASDSGDPSGPRGKEPEKTVSAFEATAKELVDVEERLRSSPFDRKLLSRHYRLCIACGRYDEAERTLKKLCAIEKDSTSLWVNRIALYRIMKRYDEAKEEGRRLLLSNPSCHEALNNLALVYSDTGDHDEAIRLIESAEAIDPSDERTKLNKAKILSRSGKRQKSLLELNSILLDNPAYGKAINNEGVMKYESGEREGGEISFSEAIKAGDQNGFAETNAAIALLNRGKYNEAIRKLTELETRRPEDPLIKKTQAQAFLYAGRYTEAEKKAVEALELTGENAELRNIEGAALFMREKYEDAEDRFKKALWSDPDSPAANSNLALCFKKKALFAKAEVFLNAAIEKDPYNPDLHYNLATVYEARGRNNEAIGEFERYLELSPDVTDKPEVRERIRQLQLDVKRAENGVKKNGVTETEDVDNDFSYETDEGEEPGIEELEDAEDLHSEERGDIAEENEDLNRIPGKPEKAMPMKGDLPDFSVKDEPAEDDFDDGSDSGEPADDCGEEPEFAVYDDDGAIEDVIGRGEETDLDKAEVEEKDTIENPDEGEGPYIEDAEWPDINEFEENVIRDDDVTESEKGSAPDFENLEDHDQKAGDSVESGETNLDKAEAEEKDTIENPDEGKDPDAVVEKLKMQIRKKIEAKNH